MQFRYWRDPFALKNTRHDMLLTEVVVEKLSLLVDMSYIFCSYHSD